MNRTNFHTQELLSASKSLGIKFKRLDMLADALTHPSVVQNLDPRNISRPSTYQRLEFLGDRVLGLVIAERLIDTFPNETEGELARRYAVLVSTAALADVARRIGLASHVKFSAGEEAQHGADNDANLADTCEAVIGAVYLDGGLCGAAAPLLGPRAPRWLAAPGRAGLARGTHAGATGPRAGGGGPQPRRRLQSWLAGARL